MVNCENCKKKIKEANTACYARESCVYLCSLDCLTDYAHEYLGCESVSQTLLDRNDNQSTK